jgi:large subunit ribosomal protein L18
MPRLAVFRSNRAISAQLIDDDKATTLAHASTKELGKEGEKKTKKEQAQLVGALIAKRAKEGGITKAVLDRRSYRYHGRVRALAEGARAAGLTI